jgi:hypothetical protein
MSDEWCTIYFSVSKSIHYVLCVNCSGKWRSSSNQDQYSFQKATSFKCFPGGFLTDPVVSEIAVRNHAKIPWGKGIVFYKQNKQKLTEISRTSFLSTGNT